MLETREQRNKLRQQLDTIDKMLTDIRSDPSELWLILTALRGPDSGDGWIKEAYTVPIRSTAFPETAKNNNTGADFDEYTKIDFDLDLDSGEPMRSPLGDEDEKFHYRNHIRAAAVRLRKLRDTAEEDKKEDVDDGETARDDG